MDGPGVEAADLRDDGDETRCGRVLLEGEGVGGDEERLAGPGAG